MGEGHAALPAEVHIGLVDDHHAVRVGLHDPLHLIPAQGQAGGGVGVGDHNGLVPPVVVPGVQGEVLLQGDHVGLDAVQVAEHGVKAVGEVGEGRSPAVGGVGQEGEVQRLVGAVGHEHVLRPHPVLAGQGRLQLHGRGVGVQPQPGRFPGVERRGHAGGGRIGGLVGVELHIVFIFRLLPRGVGGQLAELTTEKLGHGTPSSFIFYFISSLK